MGGSIVVPEVMLWKLTEDFCWLIVSSEVVRWDEDYTGFET
jgi:hypothetical protein